MAVLTHVCLSDLHLGAAYSILTGVTDGGALDLSKTSPSLDALGRALAQQMSSLTDGAPPTLVLLGDVLDMGLSPTGDVVRAYRRFVETLFPADRPPLFSDQLVCVPGNHDHHLWRAAQDEQLLDALGRLPPAGDATPELIENTALFGTPGAASRLLTAVMRSYPHLANARVAIAYPNFGLFNEANGRCIVLHHGHYTDAMYLAMSSLDADVSGRAARPKSVAGVERQNGAWVDFLWSDLGSAGRTGHDVTTLYQIMRDAGASHRFCEQLSRRALSMLSSGLGVPGGTQVTNGITVDNLVRGLVDASFGRGAESERNSYLSVMSDGATADLRWYVGGPVCRQLRDEGVFDAVRELSFVFGHTHKPFQDELVVAPWSLPVSVYNTGGWVMDQPTMAPTQGASAIFIDADLNIAAQRLFNDPANGVMAPVHVRGAGGFRDRDNVLLGRVQAALDSSADRWAAFSDCARRDVALRAECLLAEFFDRSKNGSARAGDHR
ncbi:metallophosphoesterase [Piscinibacter sp. XHJ-5]|uniref:metallophosphoesterase n=1 Tax=Piscinibacter sp. XHJ-5 TaxID=3037797 RepID=UPI0024530CF1|nr:metallophosphoesterase [Piscinibacter sp. XHJ-5]